MILNIALLLLLFNAAGTTDVHQNGNNNKDIYNAKFSLWPSAHNAVYAMRLKKREAEIPNKVGESEGGLVDTSKNVDGANAVKDQPTETKQDEPVLHQTADDAHAIDSKQQPPDVDVKQPSATVQQVKANNDITGKVVPDKVNPVNAANETISQSVVSKNETSANATASSKAVSSQLDINNPGVLKRGLIVFGGFGILAIAYYMFFKRGRNKNDTNNTHNMNETTQFRYGVLQSEDQRDHLELSRMPLTMDSDEDDDEDLEIFDLQQKKKSLSYVNLQPNDDEFDATNSYMEVRENDNRDNLLLDIDDKPGDTLINWTNNEK